MDQATIGWTTPSPLKWWIRAWRPASRTSGRKWNGASHGKGAPARPSHRAHGSPGRCLEAGFGRAPRRRQSQRRMPALLRGAGPRAEIARANCQRRYQPHKSGGSGWRVPGRVGETLALTMWPAECEKGHAGFSSGDLRGGQSWSQPPFRRLLARLANTAQLAQGHQRGCQSMRSMAQPIAGTTLAVFASLGLAHGQTADAPPAFEVASVKPSPLPPPGQYPRPLVRGGPDSSDPGMATFENFDLEGGHAGVG